MLLRLTTYIVYFVFVLCIATSCRNKSDAGKQFSYLVNSDNGLHQIKVMPLFEYTIQYQSADIMAMNALDEKDLTPANFEEKHKDFKDYYYILLSLKPSKINKNINETLLEASGDLNTADQFLQILQFGLQPYLKLTSGNEELPCVLYHAQPPTFKNGAMLFNLVFLKESDSSRAEDLLLTIDIPNFPENIPSFVIKRNDLLQIPNLKL